jgi:AP2-associated kinase
MHVLFVSSWLGSNSWQIYSTRSPSETRGYARLPPPREDASLAPVVGLQKVAPVETPQVFIPEVMPMRRGRPKAVPAEQTQKPSGIDPFAALDSKDFKVRSAAVDDLSAKYPSLDEFSILHDKGASFQFTSTGAVEAPSSNLSDPFSKRVTEVLADEAFAKPTAAHTGPAAGRGLSPGSAHRLGRGTQLSTRSHSTLAEPLPSKATLISTSPKASPPLVPMDGAARSSWRTAQEPPRPHSSGPPGSGPPSRPSSARLGNPEAIRTPTQTGFKMPTSSVSSRPSLEGQRPALDGLEPTDRSKSANSRPRPSSAYLNSGIDSVLDRDATKGKGPLSGVLRSDASGSRLARADSSDDDGPDDHIASDVDFLRSIESSDDSNRNRSRRRSSSGGKTKRASIPTISLSGTKQLLAGKFGEAFRRFETNTAPPEVQVAEQESRRGLTAPLSPIMGSEATGTSGRSDEDAVDETEALSPEVRRELERRRLSQEEKRVAAAGAEYRRKLETGDRAKGASKAAMIQKTVKTLLEETKNANVSRTAEGYGKYTDMQSAPPNKPSVPRKPVARGVEPHAAGERSGAPSLAEGKRVNRPDLRPNVAPKPLAFRANNASPIQGRDEDWEASFSKRYPSLSGIEMVETEITKESVRVRDV